MVSLSVIIATSQKGALSFSENLFLIVFFHKQPQRKSTSVEQPQS